MAEGGNDDSRDEKIAELIDFYLAEVRTGSDGQALITRLLVDNPDVAEDLKRLLPALAAAEHLGGGDSSAATVAAAPVPGAAAPARLGPYAIERELGRGGMGVVYLALEDGTGRRVALKLLPPGASGKAAERFLREARIAAGLDHPGIVPILTVGEEGGGATSRCVSSTAPTCTR